MSSQSNETGGGRSVSKVSFSPISSDLLIVRIRKMSSEIREEDIPKMASSSHPIPSYPATQRDGKSKNKSRSKIRDKLNTASTSSQTVSEEANSHSDAKLDSTPCLRHSAENISRKACDIPSEKISMCNNCSKSMLSYIFLVQDFLDSLAKEIGGSDASDCLQCARQEVRNSIVASGVKDGGASSDEYRSRVRSGSRHKGSSDDRGKRVTRAKGHRHESKKGDDFRKESVNPSSPGHTEQQRQQMDFAYSVTPPSNDNPAQSDLNLVSEQSFEKGNADNQQFIENSQYVNQQCGISDSQNSVSSGSQNFSEQRTEISSRQSSNKGSSSDQVVNELAKEIEIMHVDSVSRDEVSQQTEKQSSSGTIFMAPTERMQPNYNTNVPLRFDEHYHNNSNDVPVDSPTLFKDNVDGIVSTLSNVDREVYDNARNRAGWEGMTEPLERMGLPSGALIASEAYVTFCRNNAEAIGCLVVGTSLLLCRTTRTLCVLVSDGVSTAFRGALSSVFHNVQFVRSLDSLGTTKIALLEQPDLGITFEKLNIWRLDQFTKCVYLNPDTLVIQNCDELFYREELSAVPDIGWPDCFNSGVFVYSPSVHTFWQLLEFAEKQGSYDGGDQGLLNSYFRSWSSDITKKLSFIYNLMANVSYTYAPAFRQFGRDVKIVQFHGSFKPWHVKFFSSTGQISPSSPVHPTYVQFVHIWLSIFRISVLRLLSQEIQSYAASQETISAVETLRFFPLPSESETDFFLTPPSVRLRLAERKLKRSTSLPISEARRRKSAEFFRDTIPEDIIPEANIPGNVGGRDANVIAKATETDSGSADIQEKEKLETSVSEADEVFDAVKESENKVQDRNALPGAEVGDYHGMKAWEQGRMDYQGSDSSDNVIKRLQFLITRPQ